ncbi:hypothetical protein DYB32_009616 [Aphanomyces invadans]|uniref:CCHC-type domain-containing protein n=1 Tax=Aphanomyces invadans TaxID=157072 RepID=A0A3R6VEZ3_9STRA|nr:hypothetical protein DYB32_009616 [Aphanomyces invadans]
MLDDLMRVLEQDHQEWVLHQEGKIVVEIMTKAIKPEALKTAVQKQLQLQRNKGLKSDVFRYVKWLRQFSAGFQLYVGLDEVMAPAPQTGASKTDSLKSGRGKPDGADKNRGKPDAADKSRGRPDGPEKGRGRFDGNGRADGRAPGVEKPAITGVKEDYKPRKKLGCLKCGDKSHYVADCPAATPGEADRLLDAQLKKWRDGVTVLGSHPNRHPTERGALVEGLVRVENVLLDTGADVNVVSRGVMDALAEKNATVAVQVHDQPRLVYPYGVDVKPLEMKRHVKFGMVTLDTTCGPLTLRGLQAWIDETSTAMDFIVSRPVMEVLGFSIDDLLDGARRQQAEWDVSPGSDGPVTNMSRMQRLLAEERDPPEPELADTDGMACATPEVEIPPPSDLEDERRRMKRDKVFGILMAKVAEAETREMSWELARNLLDDIPVVFTKWCKAHKSTKHVAPMMKDLGLL